MAAPKGSTVAEIAAELMLRWGFRDEDEIREAVRWIRRWRSVTAFLAQLARYMLWTAVGWAILALLNQRFGWFGKL